MAGPNWGNRLIWFVGLWVASVAVLGIVAFGIHMMIP